MKFWLISLDDGVARECDIPEEKFALFAEMNPHVIHFYTDE